MAVEEEKLVRGEIFNDSGKWKYSVKLAFPDYGDRYVTPHQQLEDALHLSTMRGLSEVTFRRLPISWTLVVFDPPFGYPAMVRGTL